MKINRSKEDNEKLKVFIKEYISPEKNKLTFLVLLIFGGTFIKNINPYLYGEMIDSISFSDMEFFTKLIVIYFVVTMFTTLLGIYEDYLGQTLNFKVSKNVQKNMFDKIIRLKTKDYNKYDTGEFMYRLNGDSDEIVSFCINVITSFLHIAINIGISLYFVFKISTRLTSVAIFYIPVSFIVTFLSRKYFKELVKRRKEYNDKYYSFQNEIFSNNTGVKSYMLEDSINEKFENFISRDFRILKSSIFLNNTIDLLNTLITVISSLYVIYLSAILIRSNLLTIGTMVSFNTYINNLFSSISEVLKLNISKQKVMISLNRVNEIMFKSSEEREISVNDFSLKNVEFEGNKIYFRYSEKDKPVLNNFSFEILSFGFYGFVGKNGCGKSTIAKLLVKLYDIEHGELKLNGESYKDIPKEKLRKNITYVQKEDFFFDDTILNNIKLGNPYANDKEVIEMCKKVDLDEYINILPEKYETVIGEGASTLSSGQKQKLSIARALLRNTKIYIFDEVTANLDGKSEKLVVSILKELSKNSVVIFISHKVSSIIECDEIFLIDEGSVAERGNHDYLIQNSELYSELFKNVDSNIVEEMI